VIDEDKWRQQGEVADLNIEIIGLASRQESQVCVSLLAQIL